MSIHSVKKTIVLLTPTFVPDPAAVGQHMADLAIALAGRGHHVVVYTANRGYDNPRDRYPARENMQGVEVRRLPLSSFGKSSFITRTLGSLSFMLQCIWKCLLTPRLAGIVITTSPPFSDLAGCIAAMFRPRVPVIYWAMDLYAEQVLALGKLSKWHPLAILLQMIQRFVIWRSSLIVALDRFMADILRRRGAAESKVVVIPPWSHEQVIESIDPATNPFRIRHGLVGKFVVMYSGNHTRTNPLTTVLQAAVQLKDDPQVRFCFVGGGVGKKEVEETIATHQLTNAVSLPYQPLTELKYSLSAADLHVVTLGEKMVGIVHPCKVYGAMAVGKPILYVGPHPSHVSDLLEADDIGWHLAHGDVSGVVNAINEARASSQLEATGQRARTAISTRLSQAELCGQVCRELERVMSLSPSASAAPGQAVHTP